MYFGREYHGSDAHSPCTISDADAVTSPSSGDVNFDYLVKVASARFLHCEVTTLSFVIVSMLWRDTLRLCKYTITP